ncbi:MAG: aryl-sulfate sulfotransferase [Planctomycetaceae bacterium]
MAVGVGDNARREVVVMRVNVRFLALLLLVPACGGGGGTVLDALAFSILSPAPNGAANDPRPVIRWGALAGYDRYRVRCYRDAALADLIESSDVQGVTEFAVSVDLPDGSAVYAVVDILDDKGAVVVTSAVRRFKVILLPPDLPRFALVRRDAQKTQPGYRLFNITDRAPPTPADRVSALFLVNEMGEVVWFWRRPLGTFTDARVLPNGNLLYIFITPAAGTQKAYESTWDGVEVWQSRDGVKVHHEVGPGPGGNHLCLTYTHRNVGALLYEGDGLELVDPATNTVLWSWDIFDHVSTDEVDPIDILLTGRSGMGQDWTHSNAAVWDPDRSLIWISVRHLERLLGVHYPSGDVRVVLGKGGLGGDALLSHPHAPEVQEDGTLLVFDNGNRRVPPYSRVVQLRWDEAADTVTELIEYRETPDYYAGAVGDADRLPNDNILVVAGTLRRIFEITPPGENVWEIASSDTRFWVYRAEHVAPHEIPAGVLPFD